MKAHTAELIREIAPAELYGVMQNLKFPKKYYMEIKTGTRASVFTRYDCRIEAAKIIRIEDESSGCMRFYVLLKIDLNRLITGVQSIELYDICEQNNQKLAIAFHDFMISMFHENDDITKIDSWNTRRLDYTFDFRFDDETEKRMFLKLTKATSSNVRRKAIRLKNVKLKEQSTAEANGSAKIIFYDKEEEVKKMYTASSAYDNLCKTSQGIVRFELQCESRKIKSIKKSCGFESRSILNYLDNRIATELMKKAYVETVGKGRFFNCSRAASYLNKANLKPKKRADLYNTMRLIAQARHLSVARVQAENGTKIKNTNVIVKCCQATFRARIKELQNLGINPVFIPKDSRIKEMDNPWNQLEAEIERTPAPINAFELGADEGFYNNFVKTEKREESNRISFQGYHLGIIFYGRKQSKKNLKTLCEIDRMIPSIITCNKRGFYKMKKIPNTEGLIDYSNHFKPRKPAVSDLEKEAAFVEDLWHKNFDEMYEPQWPIVLPADMKNTEVA